MILSFIWLFAAFALTADITKLGRLQLMSYLKLFRFRKFRLLFKIIIERS